MSMDIECRGGRHAVVDGFSGPRPAPSAPARAPPPRGARAHAGRGAGTVFIGPDAWVNFTVSREWVAAAGNVTRVRIPVEVTQASDKDHCSRPQQRVTAAAGVRAPGRFAACLA